MAFLALDFGGTQMRAGWFSADLALLQHHATPSHVDQPQADVIRRLIETGRAVVPAGAEITGIGLTAPGAQAFTGYIRHAPTLPDWDNVPLAQIISDAFDGVPVYMQNDANLAALAEFHLGAGQGRHDPMIYLTISTGIGGGAVVDGELYTGSAGLAIEPGHLFFHMPDGALRDLEALVSGTALGRIALERLTSSRAKTILREADEPLTGKMVGEAAMQGDAFALEIITEAGRWLGLGLVNILHLFNPQMVVVGGSVTRLGALLLDPARDVIHKHVIDPAFFQDNQLQIAQLGDDVALIGAALYARMQTQFVEKD